MAEPDHEAIIIGAGVCGIYQLYRLKELGVDATVLEAWARLKTEPDAVMFDGNWRRAVLYSCTRSL